MQLFMCFLPVFKHGAGAMFAAERYRGEAVTVAGDYTVSKDVGLWLTLEFEPETTVEVISDCYPFRHLLLQ